MHTYLQRMWKFLSNTSTFLVSEHPSHFWFILYTWKDSLTRRQGGVPEDELTCEIIDQRKADLQNLGNSYEGLSWISKLRPLWIEHSALEGSRLTRMTIKLALWNTIIWNLQFDYWKGPKVLPFWNQYPPFWNYSELQLQQWPCSFMI